LAATDVMAVGCLNRLKEKGISIPKDMAIFGFDNIEVAKKSKPQLSTINMPIAQAAKKTMALLMDQIHNKNELRVEKLPCELVLRASTEINISY
ncbi:MAG: substrate-binding domain-containing protein, partial [Flavobacteriaceae bacterium]|nr:substrate-binding domain-containing protein [Flavobacteriaceae bacterium]